jgi:putative pyruvate formate lyase activating enzyme
MNTICLFTIPGFQLILQRMSVYIDLYQAGALYRRAEALWTKLAACDLCPHACKVNRLAGELGFCRLGSELVVSSYGPHHGEEPPISGTRGSGTIFLGRCNLRCVFCQNHQISQEGLGRLVTSSELAGMMLDLQQRGCHNINLVSPSHVVPQIVAGLLLAVAQGLHIPLVYNSNGYDAVETLRLLDGIIDIYLPDIKYSNDAVAARLSGATAYSRHNQLAIIEMYRQVGHLQLDNSGLATRGLILRHLVLPQGLAGSRESFEFLAENGLNRVRMSVMAQYHPTHRAPEHPDINRTITQDEYQQALNWLEELGFDNLWTQEFESHQAFLPDFKQEKPFKDN